EFALCYVSERIVSPELIGVDASVPTDTPDPPPGIVALVHLEQFEDLGRPGGILPQHPEVEVGAVGVIVHSEHFLGLATLVEVSGPVDYEVNRLACLLVGEVFVDQLASAPGIYEVIKTDARDVI